MTRFNIRQITTTAAACAMLALPAFADTLSYTAELTPGAVIPPADSSATGTADVTVDTEAKTVSWVVTYDGLTGDPIAAHIHGPAAMDENAGPVIDMSEALMEGSAEISDEQLGELEAGKYYVNVHTEKFPDGEIRGQLTVAE